MMDGMAGCGAMGIVGMVLGGLLGLALLALVVLGIVWLARRLRAPQASSSPEPLEVVRREYASGRISREEYQQRSADLTSASS